MKKLPEPFSADECRSRLNGLDLTALADATGLHRTTLSLIRSGKQVANYGTRALLSGYWRRAGK